MRHSLRTLAFVLTLWAAPALAQVEGDFSLGGGIRIGDSATTCNAAAEGAILYDSNGGKVIQFCNGTAWQNVGGGTPAGSNTQIQYNSGGAFAGSADLTWDNTSKILKLGGVTGLAQPTLGTGKVVQVVHSQTGAMATGTTTIPADNTIPQNTEGTEFMSATITPTSASNKLLIEVTFNVASNTASRQIVGALFQDTTASALAAVSNFSPATTNTMIQMVLRHEMTAGTTSATTFKFRAGPSAAATLTFNGVNGAGWFGGVTASSIRITEIRP